MSKTVCSLKTSAFAGLLSGLAADPMTSWQKAGKTTLLYRCLSKLNYVLDCPVEFCVENHIIRPMHSEISYTFTNYQITLTKLQVIIYHTTKLVLFRIPK